MRIFLIGFMGAGKSTLGKRLASKLNVSFIDADKAIEHIEKRTIPQIFKEEGEAGFRKVERNWLKELKDEEVVIALGGGTPCFNDNMRIINDMGLSIFAEVPVPIIVSRLMNAKDVRPLIEEVKHDHAKLTDLVKKMLDERMPFYKQAHIRFNASNIKSDSLDGLIEEIENKLN
jgi:shikimate kinase